NCAVLDGQTATEIPKRDSPTHTFAGFDGRRFVARNGAIGNREVGGRRRAIEIDSAAAESRRGVAGDGTSGHVKPAVKINVQSAAAVRGEIAGDHTVSDSHTRRSALGDRAARTNVKRRYSGRCVADKKTIARRQYPVGKLHINGPAFRVGRILRQDASTEIQ